MSINEIMAEIPHPLVIITVGEYGVEHNAMTAAWFSRVSGNPPLVMVAIAPTRYTWELINKYKEFGVNVVSEKLADKAINIFGTLSGRQVDKFKEARVKITRGRKIKAPIIVDAPIVLECSVEATYLAGDHYIVVGRVLEAYRNNMDKPTIWYGGSVHGIGGLIHI